MYSDGSAFVMNEFHQSVSLLTLKSLKVFLDFLQSFSAVSLRYLKVSSANSLTKECVVYPGVFVMWGKKKIGSVTEPSGTLEVVSTCSDVFPSTKLTTYWVLRQRKDLHHQHVSGSLPYMCSLLSI